MCIRTQEIQFIVEESKEVRIIQYNNMKMKDIVFLFPSKEN